ncbi:hypothetical protein ACFLYU_03340 [Candidatus Dependentiae bacterium]
MKKKLIILSTCLSIGILVGSNMFGTKAERKTIHAFDIGNRSEMTLRDVIVRNGKSLKNAIKVGNIAKTLKAAGRAWTTGEGSVVVQFTVEGKRYQTKKIPAENLNSVVFEKKAEGIVKYNVYRWGKIPGEPGDAKSIGPEKKYKKCINQFWKEIK